MLWVKHFNVLPSSYRYFFVLVFGCKFSYSTKWGVAICPSRRHVLYYLLKILMKQWISMVNLMLFFIKCYRVWNCGRFIWLIRNVVMSAFKFMMQHVTQMYGGAFSKHFQSINAFSKTHSYNFVRIVNRLTDQIPKQIKMHFSYSSILK